MAPTVETVRTTAIKETSKPYKNRLRISSLLIGLFIKRTNEADNGHVSCCDLHLLPGIQKPPKNVVLSAAWRSVKRTDPWLCVPTLRWVCPFEEALLSPHSGIYASGKFRIFIHPSFCKCHSACTIAAGTGEQSEESPTSAVKTLRGAQGTALSEQGWVNQL
jgi:hypothetical protein